MIAISFMHAADTRSLIQKARQMAAEFEFNNGYQIPVAYLAKKLADENQIYTQVRIASKHHFSHHPMFKCFVAELWRPAVVCRVLGARPAKRPPGLLRAVLEAPIAVSCLHKRV